MDADAADQAAARAAVWSRAAATYGHVGPPFFAHFGARLVALAALPPGARVLDVAAGRGAVLFPAARQVGPAGQVTAIDYAAGMVTETQAALAAAGVANATIQQMDAGELTFPAATFDAVLCGFALFFFLRLDETLAGFRRVLKPGGVLAVSTWGPADPRWQWLEEGRTQRSAVPAGTYDTAAGMTALLAGAGFTDVQVTEESAEFYYADAAEWWATMWSHGARCELEAVPAEALATMQARAAERLAALRGPHGIPVRYDVLFTRAGNPGAPA